MGRHRVTMDIPGAPWFSSSLPGNQSTSFSKGTFRVNIIHTRSHAICWKRWLKMSANSPLDVSLMSKLHSLLLPSQIFSGQRSRNSIDGRLFISISSYSPNISGNPFSLVLPPHLEICTSGSKMDWSSETAVPSSWSCVLGPSAPCLHGGRAFLSQLHNTPSRTYNNRRLEGF